MSALEDEAAGHVQARNPETDAVAEALQATALGDFRILREIGRGGMGIVYEAIQLSLGRRVALKVLPFASALDSRQLQRFKNEAQAAAQLHHTNIVPVYAVGCERGVHYYAMQLIDGQTLAVLIGQLRRLARAQAADRTAATGKMAALPAEQRRRWQQGERVTVEAYLERHAGLRADPEAVLDLIYNEVVLREEFAETPRLTEYQRRFPEFAPQLRNQFEVHGVLQASNLFSVATLVEEQAQVRPEQPGEAEGSAPPDRIVVSCAAGRPGEVTPPPAGLVTERSIQTAAHFDTVAQLGLQAADALEHAHQLGVVHRDIKPANLLVDARGKLWVTDFGLAHCQSQAGLTMSGDLLGTLRYMSPEQALAQRVVIDHRTDIYSLGATLYELLTLEPAFAGRDRQELLRQIAFEEPRRPRRLHAAIPLDLETIVLKAMAKNPQERYTTAQELADDLRRFLEDKPIRAKRATWRQRAAKWARRHKGVAWMAVGLLTVVALVSTISSALIARQLRRAEQAEKHSRREQEKTADALSRAQESATEAKRAGAKTEAINRFLVQNLLTFGRSFGRRRPSDTVGHVLQDAAQGVEKAFAGQPELEASVRLTIGMTYLDMGMFKEAEQHLRRGLELRGNLLTESADPWGREYAETVFATRGLGLALQALGRAAEAEPRLRQSAAARRQIQLHYIPWEVNAWPITIHVLGVAFSPDSCWLLASGDDDCLRLYDVATGTEIHRLVGHSHWVHGLDFSPDGRHAVSCSPDQTIRLWDVFAAREVRQFAGQAEVTCVAFSPDGRRLLSSGNDRTICLWDVQSGQQIRRFLGHTGGVSQAVFSPDGRRILSAGQDGTIRLWDVETGAELRRLQKTGTPAGHIAFSPDGGRALSAHNECLCLWDVETGQEIRRIADFGGFGDVVFTPDGRQALTTETSGPRSRLWDLDTGKELRSFHGEPGLLPVHIRISPDGERAVAGYWRGGLSLWRLGDPPPLGNEVLPARQNYEQKCRDRGPDDPETVRALDEWAALLRDRGQLDEAEKLFGRSLESKRRSLGAEHPETLAAMKTLAVVLTAGRKPAEAETVLRHCLEGYGHAQGPQHADAVVTMNLLAEVLEKLARRGEAEALLRQCLEGWRHLLGPKHPETRAALGKLARLLQAHGKAAQAAPLLRQLLEINLSEPGPENPETLQTMEKLVCVLVGTGQVHEMEEVYRRAAELMPTNASLHNNMAWLLATCADARCRNGSRAVELARKAVELAPKSEAVWNTLGAAHYRAGNWKEAIAALNKSMEIRNGGDSFDWFFLAMAYFQLGDRARAGQWYDRAAEWMDRNRPSDEELRRFRSEARELLGVREKKH